VNRRKTREEAVLLNGDVEIFVVDAVGIVLFAAAGAAVIRFGNEMRSGWVCFSPIAPVEKGDLFGRDG
jgi:hypothetical protein